MVMGTLEGFPLPPALWLHRAKPGCANAVDGNPRRVSSAPPTRPASLSLQASQVPALRHGKAGAAGSSHALRLPLAEGHAPAGSAKRKRDA
jgi:hypothetical protein